MAFSSPPHHPPTSDHQHRYHRPESEMMTQISAEGKTAAAVENETTLDKKNCKRDEVFVDIDRIFVGRACNSLDAENGLKSNKEQHAGSVIQSNGNGGSGSADSVVVLQDSGSASKSEGNKGSPDKPGWKKPPRPPRAPNSGSYGSKDRISRAASADISMLKRAKLQRLRKQKPAKNASSKTSLFALLVTLGFCAIMILQGMFCQRSNNTHSWRTLKGAVIPASQNISNQTAFNQTMQRM